MYVLISIFVFMSRDILIFCRLHHGVSIVNAILYVSVDGTPHSLRAVQSVSLGCRTWVRALC